MVSVNRLFHRRKTRPGSPLDSDFNGDETEPLSVEELATLTVAHGHSNFTHVSETVKNPKSGVSLGLFYSPASANNNSQRQSQQSPIRMAASRRGQRNNSQGTTITPIYLDNDRASSFHLGSLKSMPVSTTPSPLGYQYWTRNSTANGSCPNLNSIESYNSPSSEFSTPENIVENDSYSDSNFSSSNGESNSNSCSNSNSHSRLSVLNVPTPSKFNLTAEDLINALPEPSSKGGDRYTGYNSSNGNPVRRMSSGNLSTLLKLNKNNANHNYNNNKHKSNLADLPRSNSKSTKGASTASLPISQPKESLSSLPLPKEAVTVKKSATITTKTASNKKNSNLHQNKAKSRLSLFSRSTTSTARRFSIYGSSLESSEPTSLPKVSKVPDGNVVDTVELEDNIIVQNNTDVLVVSDTEPNQINIDAELNSQLDQTREVTEETPALIEQINSSDLDFNAGFQTKSREIEIQPNVEATDMCPYAWDNTADTLLITNEVIDSQPEAKKSGVDIAGTEIDQESQNVLVIHKVPLDITTQYVEVEKSYLDTPPEKSELESDNLTYTTHKKGISSISPEEYIPQRTAADYIPSLSEYPVNNFDTVSVNSLEKVVPHGLAKKEQDTLIKGTDHITESNTPAGDTIPRYSEPSLAAGHNLPVLHNDLSIELPKVQSIDSQITTPQAVSIWDAEYKIAQFADAWKMVAATAFCGEYPLRDEDSIERVQYGKPDKAKNYSRDDFMRPVEIVDVNNQNNRTNNVDISDSKRASIDTDSHFVETDDMKPYTENPKRNVVQLGDTSQSVVGHDIESFHPSIQISDEGQMDSNDKEEFPSDITSSPIANGDAEIMDAAEGFHFASNISYYADDTDYLVKNVDPQFGGYADPAGDFPLETANEILARSSQSNFASLAQIDNEITDYKLSQYPPPISSISSSPSPSLPSSVRPHSALSNFANAIRQFNHDIDEGNDSLMPPSTDVVPRSGVSDFDHCMSPAPLVAKESSILSNGEINSLKSSESTMAGEHPSFADALRMKYF
ncbi:hypothetical protein NADFUDRAFT_45320 [Nadsonia fulvescens var. elongata DSM 6958]|uniref:Uncharacterized protein n=1 Tax=Nadsonia fulvescens var. elongata DSM 6958 TaxID=857566 RepID=A0A1E3PP87_9ASCO|nr:hypothetical protein NADFUDRAFT_45320 [Nadsonia fulvescens var. elongata DSM 6958]